MSRSQVAEELNIAVSTVDSHRNAILQECSKAWSSDSEGEIDVQFLRQRFAPFLNGLDEI